MQKYLPFLILWVLSNALTIESTTSLNESSVPKSLLKSGWGRHGHYSEDESEEDENGEDDSDDDNMDNDDDTNTLQTSETSQNIASLQSPSILLLIALSALV